MQEYFGTNVNRWASENGFRFAGVTYDADAQAYFTQLASEGVILNSTQKSAADTFVTDLKTANIWTKIFALYLMMGGSATAHKYNLKDPRDLDAAFRLVFTGGWTHSATGALPNGVNAYADTKLVPSTSLTNNNTHFAFYSGTDSNLSAFDFGVIDGTVNAQYSVRTSLAGGSDILFDSYGGGSDRVLTANASSLGFYIDSVTSGASHKAYKNGVQVGSTVSPANNITTLAFPVFLATRNFSGVPSTFSSRECRLFSIGSGLSDAEAAAYYTAVQTFQTSLSRQTT